MESNGAFYAIVVVVLVIVVSMAAGVYAEITRTSSAEVACIESGRSFIGDVCVKVAG